MKAGTTLYLNSTDHRIELAIGGRPGSPWTRYDADPGEAVEGSDAPAYRERFLAAGYVQATPEEVELARMYAAEAKARAAVKAVAAPMRAPVEIPVAETQPAVATKPQKGSRGADRGSKG